MHEYHYSLEGKTFGPVSLEQLKGLNIIKDTLVWRDGLATWVPAGSLEELKDVFKASPPPLEATPPPLNHSIAVQSSQEEEEKRKRIKKIIIWSLIGLGVLLFLILLIKAAGKSEPKNKEKEITEAAQPSIDSQYEAAISNGNTPSSAVGGGADNSQTTYTPAKKPRQKTAEELRKELFKKESKAPLSYLSGDATSRSNLALNTIIEGTISNNATLADFKNVKVEVSFYSQTGMLLDNEIFTIMEFVPAGESVSFRHKRYGIITNVSYIHFNILSAEFDKNSEWKLDEPCRI